MCRGKTLLFSFFRRCHARMLSLLRCDSRIRNAVGWRFQSDAVVTAGVRDPGPPHTGFGLE